MNRKLAILVSLALLAVGAAARAEAPDPGDAGIFFSPTPTSGADARRTVGALETFSFYVLSYQVPGGMEAYEFAIPVPAGLVATGGRILPAGATAFDPTHNPESWIVGTGGFCQGAAGWFTMIEYRGAMFLSDPGENIAVCMTGAHPSSFPNGEPGYLVCHAVGDIRNFGRAYAGCAMINCTNCDAVPATAVSFGAVKARF